MVKDEFLNKVESSVDGETNSTNLHSAKKKMCSWFSTFSHFHF